MKKTSKEIHKVLRYSKEELHELSYREDDGSVHYLDKHEVGDVRMLVRYKSHLIAKYLLPKDIDSCLKFY